VEFSEDVRMSETILSRLTEAYRKLRNTFRYALGNLDKFSHETDAVAGEDLYELDQWILLRAEDLIARCRDHYSEFAFHKLYRAVYDFATLDLSSVYFDVLKDRLYTSAPKSLARRSAQTALYRVSHALVRLLAPILSFTTEEVWPHLGFAGSVHTALFPEPEELSAGIPAVQRARTANWDRLMEVRQDVLKVLEVARQEKYIGAPLEARIRISADSRLYPLLDEYRDYLPGLFIVSQVTLEQSEAFAVAVERAAGIKCERCWKYTEDIGFSPDFPTVCASCSAILEEILNGA
jgi:isoleucyl-tRNA synthetase